MTAIQVQFTVGDEARGAAIADELVERRLVACCQAIGPITSTYWWEGRKEVAAEWLFVAKTAAERFDEVAAVIARLHPYDVPEIIATPIVAGTAAYLSWIEAETRG
jgi:periplasmic divalent cation tolerance protein